MLTRRTFLATATGLAGTAGARASDDFYRGKTMTIVVGFAPGGGIDTAGRLIARHLPRFIPGTPKLLVQNMEGASGVVAANYLSKRVAGDGLTIAVPGRSWHVEGLVHSPGVQFDVSRLSYIGSTGTMNSFAWVRTDTGLHSFGDLAKSSRKIVFGALGAGTPTAMIPALLAANGVPIRLVVGYTSTSRLLVAMEQGEVPAVFLTEDSFALHRTLIEQKVVAPILQSKPDLPDLPMVRDVIPREQWPVLELTRSAESLGLMVVGPPGIPEERLVILRSAFIAMAQDDAYQADVARFETARTTPLPGQEVEFMMRDLANLATPEVVAAYNRLKQET